MTHKKRRKMKFLQELYHLLVKFIKNRIIKLHLKNQFFKLIKAKNKIAVKKENQQFHIPTPLKTIFRLEEEVALYLKQHHISPVGKCIAYATIEHVKKRMVDNHVCPSSLGYLLPCKTPLIQRYRTLSR